jgi:hypothetical protein
MVRSVRWLASAAALLGGLTVAADARAGEAEARAAFEEGLALVDAGRLDDARVRFERSYAEKRSVGALLNLGDLEEKLGNLPRAHVRFREAEELAAVMDPERGPEAKRRANALRPKIAVLTFVSSEPAGAATITVDGAPAASHGLDVSLAPGRHTVRIEARGATRELVVDAQAGESRREALLAGPPPPPSPITQPPEPSESSRSTAGWITVGAGGAAVVAGLVLGGLALAKKDDLTSLCAAYPSCAPNLRDQATALDDSGRALATGSTIAFVVGGLAMAGGVVLLATSPPKRAAGSVQLTARSTSLLLEGRF